MKENTKIYWKGIEQLKNDTEFVKNAEKEFPEYLPISNSDNNEGGNSRRDFLKMMGFGIAAVSLAACESPVRKAIPYLNKPVDVDPGVPNYYASSYINGSDYCSIVVKTREGRPIKIDGNKLSKYSGGGTSAQVEASVLSLYDKQRFQNPMKSGAAVTWDALDAEVTSKLAEIATAGGQIRIVTHSIVSPSTKLAIEKFIAKYPGTQVVTYDAISYSGMLNANAASFGSRALPFYQFNKAKAIVSVGADFLGTWLNPTLFSRQFAETRKLGPKKKDMSRLYSFETNLSLTGSNADYRSTIKPSEVGTVVGNLYNLVAAKAGVSGVAVSKMESPALTKAANDLWAAKGESLVVCGENDTNVQTIVNAINNLLGNYGTTLSWDAPVSAKQGDDAVMDKFIADLGQGAIGGVIFYNCNPAYDHPKGAAIASGISKTALSLSTADRPDETNSAVTYIAPDSHFLESWNDAEPAKGHFSLGQPSISNIFNTRQAQQSFLSWSGEAVTYLDFIKDNWRTTLFAGQTEELDFQMFWDKCLYNGVYSAPAIAEVAAPVFAGNADAAASSIASKYKTVGAIELSVYESIAIGAGEQANNPWLQEMPDPISKVCWENYISISQSMATELGIEMKEGFTTKATLDVNGTSVVLPVVVQPGQAAGTIGVALGYGRTKAGKVADGVGVNAYAFLSASADGVSYSVFSGVSVTPTGEQYRIAQTQTHQTYMGRETVIQEATLSDYKADASAGRYKPMIATATGLRKPDSISLWKGHEYANHHWAMVIDLNSCTGCGSCTVACQVENNIPVVGKQEVVNRREMSWLRIDRYYSSQGSKEDKTMQGLSLLEKAAENPEVTFQPMMCQQCNNAPCETVCPVAATTHSTEGLNQMTYNRCIGTRYCANNCPFKVRRFNWFKYHDNRQFPDNTAMNNELGKMVLNPDVTVRARGVMEKCSFCVQRIQAGKLSAKKEGRRPVDGDVSTACASACPSEAIVFGDLKDQNSKIAQLLKLSANDEGDVVVTEERAYNVLEEIGVKPNVWYLTKIRNKELTDNQA